MCYHSIISCWVVGETNVPGTSSRKKWVREWVHDDGQTIDTNSNLPRSTTTSIRRNCDNCNNMASTKRTKDLAVPKHLTSDRFWFCCWDNCRPNRAMVCCLTIENMLQQCLLHWRVGYVCIQQKWFMLIIHTTMLCLLCVQYAYEYLYHVLVRDDMFYVCFIRSVFCDCAGVELPYMHCEDSLSV